MTIPYKKKTHHNFFLSQQINQSETIHFLILSVDINDTQ